MKVFATRSCQHLLATMNVARGALLVKQFSDGELYIRVQAEVAHQKVWVLAATPAPADHILELIFLLDALQRCGAYIHLLLTYCGYARQDRAAPGEALSAEIVLCLLRQFVMCRTVIVHIHNPLLRRFLDFEDLILLDFFMPLVYRADCIVAPDEGGRRLVTALAERANKEAIMMHKVRKAHEHVQYMNIEGNVRNKHVLIVDDMIATGGTVAHAARLLKEAGATTVTVAATHGVFSGDVLAIIDQGFIDQVYVTNSLLQSLRHRLITVVDCAPMLETIVFTP